MVIASSPRTVPPAQQAILDQLDISVVLPCLNEEASVASCVTDALSYFERAGLEGEVIVVDNGSTDRSKEEAENAGARVLEERRRGYGAAHLRGFTESRGKYIVMADADATYDVANLDPLIEPLRNGYDMTVGNRMDNMAPGAMTWSHRVIGTPAITFLLKIFTGSNIGDSQCGLRAFTREAFEKMELRSSGMELASEMVLKAYRRGLKVAEEPIPYAAREGESKLNTIRDGWRHLRFLLLYTPMYLFLVPGALMLLAGLLALTATGGVTIGSLTWQPVFAGGALVIVGTNALMIGMACHMYAASRGLISEDALTRFYRKYGSLEAFLGLAGLLFLVGTGLDALIFYRWVSGNGMGLNTMGTAALAQSAIIVAVNLALGGFLAALIDIE